MIGKYHFGSITINGKIYNYDVEVRWPGEVLSWWREQSHLIDVEDIKRAVSQKPKIIIIGAGASGIAQITEQAKEEIKAKGIKLIIKTTEQAIKTFNVLTQGAEEKRKPEKAIGLFHLTC